VKVDEEALHASSQILENKLSDFGVSGSVVAVRPGPVITTYEFEPAPGVKVNRVVSLADDLQMALRAVSVRILAPIPGKAVVGIEVSNAKREKVCLREILDSSACHQTESPLALALGKDTVGNPVVTDLARMPHLLVAGATGTGKSVSLNVMIMSILARATPRDVRFIMIDPKMLELSLYEGLPHQLSHVITNPKEAGVALQEVVRRMEYRYKLLKDKGVRNIGAYNRVLETGETDPSGIIKLTEVVHDDEDELTATQSQPQSKTQPELNHQRLPYLIVLVDELADLMLTVGREIEEPITRLAQMGRAAGIHLILATQRPSVDVITGLIKANFPARVSFQVSSRIDSRTILDAVGAERLLGDGDMLFLPPGSAKPQRIHGAFVSEPEIRKFAAAIKKQGKPVFDEELVAALESAQTQKGAGPHEEEDYDEMYEQARDLVMESRQASISWLQRRLRVGYNRAARMIERMEREGLIAPAGEAGKPREVLVQAQAEAE
jgi:S-DNA-T family DNA segregation ATPase FtsK/SpoIIIE